MRNLLDFLIKYNYWFLFILLEIASFVLLFKYNNYQHSIFFTSANVITGKVYELSSKVVSYFHLQSVNDDLLDRNVYLEQQLANQSIQERINSDDFLEHDSLSNYKLYKAYVINNSLTQVNNFITLDKGSSDGIKPEMGVIDGNGVVGIVYKTSSHYSVVISLLNSLSNLSCKIKDSQYFGHLYWEPGDAQHAFLTDLPRHAKFSLGDTIVTSGYSAVFPEGLMVGMVDDMLDSEDGLSYMLKVRLASNFGTLGNVRVIENINQKEQRDLEGLIDR
ncbi:MAG: rod shape-determining protein MreC [Bacteroidales bacterium]|nr:rod shape-determining protein MreC [Bacteroidales bacterium]